MNKISTGNIQSNNTIKWQNSLLRTHNHHPQLTTSSYHKCISPHTVTLTKTHQNRQWFKKIPNTDVQVATTTTAASAVASAFRYSLAVLASRLDLSMFSWFLTLRLYNFIKKFSLQIKCCNIAAKLLLAHLVTVVDVAICKLLRHKKLTQLVHTVTFVYSIDCLAITDCKVSSVFAFLILQKANCQCYWSVCRKLIFVFFRKQKQEFTVFIFGNPQSLLISCQGAIATNQ